MATREPTPGLNVKIDGDELKGRYSNLLRITHTREEFILDFINFAPPEPVVTARIITSPGHLKRIIQALRDNLKHYEDSHGIVEPAPPPEREVN
jgi:hypothetical protein